MDGEILLETPPPAPDTLFPPAGPPEGAAVPSSPRPLDGAGTGFRAATLNFAGGDAGEPLLDPTLVIEGGSTGGATGESGENTAQIAGEIEDLIFRSCPACHSSFGGDLEVCPHDGTRLSEHSLFRRETLFFGRGGPTAAALELKKYCPGCKRHFPLHLKVCSECGSSLMIPTLGGPAAPGRPPPPELGPVIADKYRILEDIGAGGFGSVHLAKHESLGKRYAIKVLRSQLSDRMNFRDRFHEEALKLSRLEDENIVKVIDFGEWQDFQYMVTEYVEGKDLSSIIYQERSPPLRAARIMRQVAGALSEAHAKKIVHLDLKPNNILVTQRRGRDLVKVIDFGIAEIYSETRARRQESVAGTCTYMAPEQWRRDSLDPRTDVYSFGVIFYEFLAGRPPFRHPRISDLEKAHCQEAPTPLRKLRPDLPAELERLVHKCLEKEPAKRVQSAAELEAALDGYLRRVENRPFLRRVLAAAAVLVVLALGAWGIWELVKDREPPRLSVKIDGVPDAGKVYRTRQKEVVLVLEAEDNREVHDLVVSSAALEGGEKVLSGGGRHRLPIPLAENSTTLVTALAFDRAGNYSAKTSLTLEQVPAPQVKVAWEKLPRFTRESSVDLVIEDLVGTAATVVCRQSAEPAFEVEIEKLDGSLKPSDPRASKGELPGPGEPLTIVVPLQPGLNTVELRTRDVLSPEKSLDPGNVRVIRQLNAPLALTASVAPGKEVVKLRAEGEWLSRRKDILVEVSVKDAANRLLAGAEMRYRRLPQKDRPGDFWEAQEVERGFKTIPVALEEGLNTIFLEPLADRYDNRSEEVKLIVRLDQTAPVVEVPDQTVEYFREALPTVRFRLQDAHPDDTKPGLVKGAAGEEVKKAHYRLGVNPDGFWELTFTDPSVFGADGEHRFRITARDLAGNASRDSGSFTVLADHRKPRVEVLAPAAGLRVKRGQEVPVRARIEDDFLDETSVRATVSVKAPGFASEKPILLSRTAAPGIWEAKIPVGEGGIEKPKTFDTLQPGFRITVSAADRGGREERREVALGFEWEGGDRLLWPDRSVLVFHPACRRHAVGPFWMASHEVTNRQYRDFLAKQEGKAPRSPDWPGGKCAEDKLDHPVRGVSWTDALAYAAWAKMALPSKAQWTTAAYFDYQERDDRPYPWGAEWPAGAPEPVCGGSKPSTAPVSAEEQFARGRTPFGLSHLLGNVWEMVRDGTKQVKRVGGGFDTSLKIFQSDMDKEGYLRGGEAILPDDYADNIGFRCCLVKGN